MLGRRRTALHCPCVTLSEHQTGLTCSRGEGFFYLKLTVFTKEFSPTLLSWQAVQALDVCLGCSYFLKSNQEACIHLPRAPTSHSPEAAFNPLIMRRNRKISSEFVSIPTSMLGTKRHIFHSSGGMSRH